MNGRRAFGSGTAWVSFVQGDGQPYIVRKRPFRKSRFRRHDNDLFTTVKSQTAIIVAIAITPILGAGVPPVPAAFALAVATANVIVVIAIVFIVFIVFIVVRVMALAETDICVPAVAPSHALFKPVAVAPAVAAGEILPYAISPAAVGSLFEKSRSI